MGNEVILGTTGLHALRAGFGNEALIKRTIPTTLHARTIAARSSSKAFKGFVVFFGVSKPTGEFHAPGDLGQTCLSEVSRVWRRLRGSERVCHKLRCKRLRIQGLGVGSRGASGLSSQSALKQLHYESRGPGEATAVDNPNTPKKRMDVILHN